MTDFRFNPRQMKNLKLHRRKATIQILSRLGFSAAEIARIDGDCTAWDIVEYHRFIERNRAAFRAIAKGKI